MAAFSTSLLPPPPHTPALTGGYVIGSDIRTRSSGSFLGLCLECIQQRPKQLKTTYKASFLASLFPKVTEASCSLEDLFWESVGDPAQQAWGACWSGQLPCSLDPCNACCSLAAPHPLRGLHLQRSAWCLWLNLVKFCMYKHDLFVSGCHWGVLNPLLGWPSLGTAGVDA